MPLPPSTYRTPKPFKELDKADYTIHVVVDTTKIRAGDSIGVFDYSRRTVTVADINTDENGVHVIQAKRDVAEPLTVAINKDTEVTLTIFNQILYDLEDAAARLCYEKTGKQWREMSNHLKLGWINLAMFNKEMERREYDQPGNAVDPSNLIDPGLRGPHGAT